MFAIQPPPFTHPDGAAAGASPVASRGVAPQAHHAPFKWRNPAGTRVAAVATGGAHGGQALLGDTLTGYGRVGGYDSLANARRAAYMLTRGEHKAAAGIFQQGSRFYVRAMGEFTHHDGALLALHFEKGGLTLTGANDPRLAMLVDGSTKIFARA